MRGLCPRSIREMAISGRDYREGFAASVRPEDAPLSDRQVKFKNKPATAQPITGMCWSCPVGLEPKIGIVSLELLTALMFVGVVDLWLHGQAFAQNRD